uniref:GRF-type domain-containing protein n=1 Tax=Brassica oleracea TaxID=3712 RepID=A0A3P6BDY1_BRAOL|nr:unnamed protein product [Brassica oleracea]
MIPRIVKAVGPPKRQKQLLLSSYSIVDVPMKLRLNKTCCDCGAYALKHLGCSLLGLNLSLVDDEIIMGCRQKIGSTRYGSMKRRSFGNFFLPIPFPSSFFLDIDNYSGENLEINSLMSSVNSSSTSRDRLAKQRGIPTRCNCGEEVSRFTSTTVKNSGRLFHCCPMGSEKDKTHLFKWTDKSVVEEIEDFQDLFDVLLVDNSRVSEISESW